MLILFVELILGVYIHLAIGVASYEALGHVPYLDFQLLNFSGHFRATQNFQIGLCGSILRKRLQA